MHISLDMCSFLSFCLHVTTQAPLYEFCVKFDMEEEGLPYLSHTFQVWLTNSASLR